MRAMYMLMSSKMGSVTIISGGNISMFPMIDEETALTEWTKKSLGDDLTEGCLEQLLLGGDVGVASLFAQTLRTPAKQGRGERLGNGEGEKEDNPSEDHVDLFEVIELNVPHKHRVATYPENPTPANGRTNEATDDGTKDRSTVGSGGKQSDGEAALIVIPNVGNSTASNGEWSRREDSTEEPTY